MDVVADVAAADVGVGVHIDPSVVVAVGIYQVGNLAYGFHPAYACMVWNEVEIKTW